MVVDVIRKKLGNYGKYFQSAFQLLSGGGGGKANLFSWSGGWPFVVSVIYCDWSVLHETWTAKILYTVQLYSYIEDELKKVNH